MPRRTAVGEERARLERLVARRVVHVLPARADQHRHTDAIDGGERRLHDRLPDADVLRRNFGHSHRMQALEKLLRVAVRDRTADRRLRCTGRTGRSRRASNAGTLNTG